MGHQTRARSAESKEARRAVILRAGAAILEHTPFSRVAMADVARRARLAKGTLFLYFPTKEHLVIELLDRSLDDWLGALHLEVAREDRPMVSAELTRAVIDTIAAHPLVSRLLPLRTGLLEPAVPGARREESARRLLRRLFATGSLVEQRLGLARSGDGVQLLRYMLALIAGGETELTTALTVLFNGFHRKGGRPGQGAPGSA